MSYHIISYHIISYHIISYHIMSYHIISHHIISYYIISYHIISYHIISYTYSREMTQYPTDEKHFIQAIFSAQLGLLVYTVRLRIMTSEIQNMKKNSFMDRKETEGLLARRPPSRCQKRSQKGRPTVTWYYYCNMITNLFCWHSFANNPLVVHNTALPPKSKKKVGRLTTRWSD